MEADGVLPGPDKPVSAEIVHQSGRTRITRLVVPGGTVIRKEPLGPEAERRVRHEAAMLARLRGVAGVAQLAGTPRYPESVVLADAGEASLAGAGAGPRGGGDAPAGCDAPGHHPGERGALWRRRPVPGGLRHGEFVRRDPSGVHPPRRDRR